jgi:hypothetical protein
MGYNITSFYRIALYPTGKLREKRAVAKRVGEKFSSLEKKRKRV